MYIKLPLAVRHLDRRHRIYVYWSDSYVNGMWFISTSQSTARDLSPSGLVMVLVNDCRSDVSPVNNSDSDWTIRVLMHQSFVTMAPMGPENSADIDISLQSPGICLVLREHFYDQSSAKRPAQILVCKCEITLVVWEWQKPHVGGSTALRGWCWGLNMALNPSYVPCPNGLGLKQQVHNAYHF